MRIFTSFHVHYNTESIIMCRRQRHAAERYSNATLCLMEKRGIAILIAMASCRLGLEVVVLPNEVNHDV